jgi:transposase
MIRMLIIGYVFAIRSERLLCRELQVNLAYRWFCRLSIEDKIPDHSGALISLLTFKKIVPNLV